MTDGWATLASSLAEAEAALAAGLEAVGTGRGTAAEVVASLVADALAATGEARTLCAAKLAWYAVVEARAVQIEHPTPENARRLRETWDAYASAKGIPPVHDEAVALPGG